LIPGALSVICTCICAHFINASPARVAICIPITKSSLDAAALISAQAGARAVSIALASITALSGFAETASETITIVLTVHGLCTAAAHGDAGLSSRTRIIVDAGITTCHSLANAEAIAIAILKAHDALYTTTIRTTDTSPLAVSIRITWVLTFSGDTDALSEAVSIGHAHIGLFTETRCFITNLSARTSTGHTRIFTCVLPADPASVAITGYIAFRTLLTASIPEVADASPRTIQIQFTSGFTALVVTHSGTDAVDIADTACRFFAASTPQVAGLIAWTCIISVAAIHTYIIDTLAAEIAMVIVLTHAVWMFFTSTPRCTDARSRAVDVLAAGLRA